MAPLWLMENFFEGLEDGPPSDFRWIWADNWRILAKVSKKRRQVGRSLKKVDRC
jgi:hypothetical protein